MINALVFAAVAALSPAAQKVKAIDIDRFNTPYSVTLNMENSDTHNWYGLSKSQCLFPNRGSNFYINSNPNGTGLTFSIGAGHQKFTSSATVAWHFTMDYYFDPGSVDLSSVDLLMVDFTTIPGGKLADYWNIYMYDTSFAGTSNQQSHPRQGGIYFRKSEFGGTIDWKHVRSLSFRQDFFAFPNPTTYDVTRFYATLKPVAVPPAPSMKDTL